MVNALLIESCDFVSFPIGGQLSFARQMMMAFGNRLALVGVSTDDTPVGKWIKKDIDGIDYDYFAFAHRQVRGKKPSIPARITGYLAVRKFNKQILSKGIKCVFIQSPEILIAVHTWGWRSICYCFPGVENPLQMPRYGWGKMFAGLYEKKLFSTLRNVDTILASADDEAIADLVDKSCGELYSERVIKFPTRVDTDVFKPLDKNVVRAELGIVQTDNIIVSCGRLNLVKGWDFLLEAFKVVKRSNPYTKLIFVGDGEDRQKLNDKAQELGIESSIIVTGFVGADSVVKYLNASDLYVVGSLKEGWSVAMLEALACGKPIVSTAVSGARDMIVEGANGFVIDGRDPKQFAEAMNSALALKEADKVSLGIADKYTLKNLAIDLGKFWKPLA
ncbi:MAG: hypothetical protein A2167_00330 [Planctomycetes bacterium RBG_13_46_10]|nr:MAG: hypothetical protein A2167_00330 [Planctomycetes bacterium RBG_13_46_10]